MITSSQERLHTAEFRQRPKRGMSKSSNTEGIEARLENLPFLRPMNLAKHENDSHQRIDATDFEIIQDSDYEKLMHQVEGYWKGYVREFAT